jgi:multidrug efflux pump subunit AcrA (membrane-fusion protein)
MAAAADSASTPVEVLVATPALFEDVIDLTGTVSTDADAALSPDVPGTLVFVAPVGAFVRAGQTVAQVRATGQQAGLAQAQAGVAQANAGIAQAQATVATADAGVRAARAQRQAAQAQLDLAMDQYRRQQPLYRDSILSALEFRGVESQVASARATVAQADAGIAQAQGQLRASQQGVVAARAGASASQAVVRGAQAQLGNTRIVAPFSGVVQERLMGPGELASPGMPVVRLVAGGGAVKVTAGVPERYAGEIEVGTPVQITPAAGATEARGGRVTFVGVAVDEQTRTFPVEIALDNADGALKPAMVVRLGLSRDVLQGAITVPQQAVIRDERGASVMVAVAGPGGRVVAERREVQLGPTSGDQIVLAAGVSSGDRIIVSGQASLAEGDRVRVTERRAPERAAAAR